MSYEDDILVADIETETLQETEEVSNEVEEDSSFKKEFSSYSHIQTKRDTSKYDFSKNYNPNFKKDSDFEKYVKDSETFEQDEEDLTLEKTVENYAVKTNYKSNIFKICSSLVCALLLVLCIINIASLTNLQNDVSNLQNNVNSTQSSVSELIQNAGEATDNSQMLDKAQQNGMETVDNEIEITLNPKNEVKQYEVKSNWFDEFCNFLSNLF